MTKQEFSKVIAITAEDNNYLVLKNLDNSEELIGKPKRIIFDKTGIIPEFEEREVIE